MTTKHFPCHWPSVESTCHLMDTLSQSRFWVLFQYKDNLSRYGYFRYNCKMFIRPSYRYNGYPCAGKTISLCWDSPLILPSYEIRFWTHKTADISLWADMGIYCDYFWDIDCVIMKLNCIMQQPGQGVCLCAILEMYNSLHTVHTGIAKLLVYHWYQTFDPCVHIHIWYKLYG